jgi:hypothetical protein
MHFGKLAGEVVAVVKPAFIRNLCNGEGLTSLTTYMRVPNEAFGDRRRVSFDNRIGRSGLSALPICLI